MNRGDRTSKNTPFLSLPLLFPKVSFFPLLKEMKLEEKETKIKISGRNKGISLVPE